MPQRRTSQTGFNDVNDVARAQRARTIYRERLRRRRRNRVIAVLAVVLVLAVGGGTVFALNNLQPAGQNSGEQQEQANAESQQLEAASEPEFSKPQAGDRSKDLALDPSKNSGWRLETDGEKKIYLTFDDGPSENTEKILKILDQYDVKATFFVTGHYPEKFGLIKQEYEAGHSVGMHTYTHDYSKVYASVDAYKADLERIGNVIKDQIGFVPFLFRFPGGSSNSVSAKYSAGIMTTLTQQLVDEGYQYYDWNISSGDAGSDDMPAATIVDNSCQEGWTNIMLLMHDTDAKNSTAEALPKVIEYYKERGYEFCAIDRDSYAVHHGISN